jgi:hypothetical protein
MRTGTGCKQRRTSASVGGRHVMIPALPTTPFVVLRSQFLFQLVVDRRLPGSLCLHVPEPKNYIAVRIATRAQECHFGVGRKLR